MSSDIAEAPISLTDVVTPPSPTDPQASDIVPCRVDVMTKMAATQALCHTLVGPF